MTGRKIVLTHVGTTAIQCDAISTPLPDPKIRNVPREYTRIAKLILDGYQRIDDRLINEWSESLQVGLRFLWNNPPVDGRTVCFQKSPAEIASLYQMGLQAGDRVVLLHSQTPAGTFCASLIRKCLQSSAPAQPISQHALTNDVFTLYEKGIQRLLEHIEKSDLRYRDALVYEQRLRENIALTQRYGDDETRRSTRYEIIDHLNTLTEGVLQVSFNALCRTMDTTSVIDSDRHVLTDENSVFRPMGLDVPEGVALKGVKATNGEEFLQDGLESYMQIVAREYHQMHPMYDRLCFNVTAGYKGMVPFAVLASQLLGDPTNPTSVSTEVVYLYEESTQLIPLTFPLPIWSSLKMVHKNIMTLVEHEGTTKAKALSSQPRMAAFLDKEKPGGYPNALARAIYWLIKQK